MELSKRNVFVRYYEFVYNNEPNDICSLFWGSVIGLLLSLFAVPGIYIMRNQYDFRYISGLSRSLLASLVMTIVYGLMFVIIAVGNRLLEIFGYKFTHWTGVVFGGLGIGLSLIALIFGFVLGCWYISSKISEYKDKKREERYLQNLANSESGEVELEKKTNYFQNFKDIIAAIRGKYCIKITYKD
jgi:hypothetical protein